MEIHWCIEYHEHVVKPLLKLQKSIQSSKFDITFQLHWTFSTAVPWGPAWKTVRIWRGIEICILCSFYAGHRVFRKKIVFMSVSSNKQVDRTREQITNNTTMPCDQYFWRCWCQHYILCRNSFFIMNNNTSWGKHRSPCFSPFTTQIQAIKPCISDQTESIQITRKAYDIKCTQEVLGPDMCFHLLSIHSNTDYVTTSRTWGIGKKVFPRKLQKGTLPYNDVQMHLPLLTRSWSSLMTLVVMICKFMVKHARIP